MACRNPITNQYEEYYFVKQTGKLLKGVGKTKEKAKEDLKEKKEQYFQKPLVETCNESNSPGYRYFKDEKGNIKSKKGKWKTKTLARPELAEMLDKKK